MNLDQKSKSQQVVRDLPSITCRVTENSRELPGKSDPYSNESNHLTWDLIVLWGLMISTFAVFAFALYVIWAKCNGR